ncbi:MAG: hypothetical protein R2754_17250 [Microthrixaceae bacterium]
MEPNERAALDKRLSDLEWNVKRLLGREHLEYEQRPTGGGLGPEVIEALEAGKVMEAIKRHQKNTGLGLAEAKAAVEAHRT